jgi:hypothetical protein
LTSRWYLSGLEEDAAQCGLPLPTEETAREQCLRPGAEAPDLVAVKDFLRFYITTSHPRLAEKPTADSMNTVAEWFFAGFTRVTGTETDAKQRSEVFNVSPFSYLAHYQADQPNLDSGSGQPLLWRARL